MTTQELADDPFILKQSRLLRSHCLSESGATHGNVIDRLALMTAIAAAERDALKVECEKLKDECADLQKRLIPDTMPDFIRRDLEHGGIAANAAVEKEIDGGGGVGA